MSFDLSTVETATLVFIGTLVFAALLAAFVLLAGLTALALLGTGKAAWFLVSTVLLAAVHGINTGWDSLVHHTREGVVVGDIQAQPTPSTGTYPRVILSDS